MAASVERERSCSYCQLPLAGNGPTATVGGKAMSFCCYGCVLAMQVTRADGEHGAASSILVRLGLAIFFAMNVMMMSLPAYAPHIYGDLDATPLFTALQVLALLFAIPVLVLLGVPILRTAWHDLTNGKTAADCLIVLGVAAATLLSAIHIATGSGPIYLDTAVMVLVLVTTGRYLEARAKADAGKRIAAARRPAADMVYRLSEPEGETDLASLAIGDRVRILPGELFPTDGNVVRGVGWVDEAPLTGESTPSRKDVGDEVAGGTCNLDGTFHILVTQPAHLSATARIETILREAMQQPGPSQRMADTASRWFLAGVLLVAVATGVWWSLSQGIGTGTLTALSVLVVACPCALGLATPIAIWFGLDEASKRGIIFRKAAALESASRIESVFFDKTGTLTLGTPRVVRCTASPESGWTTSVLLGRAALLETGIEHPSARAIVAAARNDPEAAQELDSTRAEALMVYPGKGVGAIVNNAKIAIGSADYASENYGAVPTTSDLGRSLIYVWDDQSILGVLELAEELRPNAASVLGQLRAFGMRIRVLSGDHSSQAIVPELVAEDEVQLALQPHDKLRAVRAEAGPVAFVGDGFNDAPAITAAELGIAFGSPPDLTRTTADALIEGGDLRQVEWLFAHAAHVRRRIRQNLLWAFGYNTLAVGAATLGMLTPVIASLLMLVSSGVTIANARRLSASNRSSTADTGPAATALQPTELPAATR